jgi:hypothetical protein
MRITTFICRQCSSPKWLHAKILEGALQIPKHHPFREPHAYPLQGACNPLRQCIDIYGLLHVVPLLSKDRNPALSSRWQSSRCRLPLVQYSAAEPARTTRWSGGSMRRVTGTGHAACPVMGTRTLTVVPWLGAERTL